MALLTIQLPWCFSPSENPQKYFVVQKSLTENSRLVLIKHFYGINQAVIRYLVESFDFLQFFIHKVVNPQRPTHTVTLSGALNATFWPDWGYEPLNLPSTLSVIETIFCFFIQNNMTRTCNPSPIYCVGGGKHVPGLISRASSSVSLRTTIQPYLTEPLP